MYSVDLSKEKKKHGGHAEFHYRVLYIETRTLVIQRREEVYLVSSDRAT